MAAEKIVVKNLLRAKTRKFSKGILENTESGSQFSESGIFNDEKLEKLTVY